MLKTCLCDKCGAHYARLAQREDWKQGGVLFLI